MNRIGLIVALLLLATLGNPAAAAESPEHPSKNARKILIVLDSVGVTHPDIKALATHVSSRIDDGYLHIAAQNIENNKFSVRYALSDSPFSHTFPKSSLRRLELHFTPDDDKRWHTTVSPQGAMVRFRMPLN